MQNSCCKIISAFEQVSSVTVVRIIIPYIIFEAFDKTISFKNLYGAGGLFSKISHHILASESRNGKTNHIKYLQKNRKVLQVGI